MSVVETEIAVCRYCGFPADDLLDGYCTYCRAQIAPERTSYALRPYQQDAFDGVREKLQEANSTLVVMPTGTGKTILFAKLAEWWQDGRVLVMAHRDELIRQAADKIERVTGEACDIEMGEYRADKCALHQRAKVLVTSVQTMSRHGRHSRFHPEDFGLLVIDEGHHAAAKTYLKVAEYFGQNPNLKIVGVTATPDRTDERALAVMFKTVAYEYQLIQAIDDGWLVPIQQQFVHVEGLDFSGIDTSMGDLNQKQLAAVVEEEKVCHKTVTATMEIAGDEQTLTFAVSVDQAERMCEIVNRHRPDSASWICGDAIRCPMDHRREVLRKFRAKEIQFLFNCAVLLEGFDQDNIGVVVPKATKSRSLYAQMIGRGTRPLDGLVDQFRVAEDRKAAIAGSAKPGVLILDFVGNSGRHKLIHTGDVLAGEMPDDLVAEATRAAMSASSKGERTDMLAQLRAAEIARKEAQARARAHIVATARYSTKTVDPFNVLDMVPKREPGWHHGRQPTEKQKAFLDKSGIRTDKLSFWQASQLIDECLTRRKKNLCTYKQAKLLAKHGWPTDGIGFKDASAIIDRIAKSGWKLTYQPQGELL